jgi:single-stranded DNA-binding protein
VSDNQVTLTGNLTDDPELRFTPNGVAVCGIPTAGRTARLPTSV